MFISPAYAQALGGGDSSGLITTVAPLALMLVVFYFFLIRPQQTKAKELKAMLDALRRGDRVVTAGGIIGTVAKVVSADELLVDIADNTRVRVVRSTVTSVLAKTEPASSKDASKDDTANSDAGDTAQGDSDKDKRKGGARRAAGGK
jgi:preprotein translocase subunit YajC